MTNPKHLQHAKNVTVVYKKRPSRKPSTPRTLSEAIAQAYAKMNEKRTT